MYLKSNLITEFLHFQKSITTKQWTKKANKKIDLAIYHSTNPKKKLINLLKKYIANQVRQVLLPKLSQFLNNSPIL